MVYTFILQTSRVKFGQRDEVLQQLTLKVASLPEEFGQRIGEAREVLRTVTYGPKLIR